MTLFAIQKQLTDTKHDDSKSLQAYLQLILLNWCNNALISNAWCPCVCVCIYGACLHRNSPTHLQASVSGLFGPSESRIYCDARRELLAHYRVKQHAVFVPNLGQ